MKIQPPKYIVGIGASAGGLEAIQDFFNHMPTINELTFIIVQHLSPDFISIMDDLLANNTSMPIITAKNRMTLKAGVVYLIPASFEARVEKNCFKLTIINRKSLPLPINTLFESIAVAYRQFALGIILSGTGADGALGMKKIADHRGLTIVQTPNEAKFSDMPNQSIATKKVNCVLPVSEMPDVILEYLNKPSEFNKDFKQIELISKSEYSDIFQLLDKHYKIDFSAYKLGTVSRRIQRRMQLLGIDNLRAYLSYLTKDSEGLKTLYQDLLIGVTEFFRDPDAFEILKSVVVPALFQKFKKTHEDIRIWINPCATGEEAYSVAILFKQYADEHNLPFAVKIFAADVFNGFVQEAKRGRYPYKSVEHLARDLLNKYFIKSKKYYEVIPEIKEKILFTTHNLLRDPPFTKMDLVCCRNLLIYINPKEQRNITDLLRFSLTIGGFLFLGPSEGLSSLEPELIVKNKQWKIFKKTKNSNYPLMATTPFADPILKGMQPITINHNPMGSFPLYAYNAILHDVVSSGFIIDTSYTVLHSIGNAREMVTLPEGIPILTLPKIIIHDLKNTLIAALNKAKNTLIPVVCDHIIMHQNHDKQHAIKMTVHPILDPNNKISYYWIRFDSTKKTIRKKSTMFTDDQKGTHHDEIIMGLEKELAEANDLLQSSLESMETVNEEMQSTNEELMASNEELQSTNEELQSVNEELYSVNLERSKKIEEVIQAKTDIDNLIRSAEICTIILNSKLEIRIFTPAVENIFNLVSHDIGRPLKNFRHNLKFDLLMVKVKDVLKNNTTYEVEVKNNTNQWYFLKIIPYYSTQKQIATGVVITLTDINDTKLLQQKKTELEKDLRLALKTGLIGIWHCDLENKAFTYDDTIKNIFGLNSLSSMNQFKRFIASIHLEDRKRLEKAFETTISKNESFEQKFRIIRPDSSVRYLSCSANLHRNESSDSNYITGICWDMTEQYWLEEKIIDAEHLNLGLDSITDGWWDWDLISKEAYLSPLLKKTLGYEDPELPNRMKRFEQLILPEDLQLVQKKLEAYIAKNSIQPMIQKIRMKHKSGRIIWVLSRRKGIANKQGKLIRMIGTLTDITALKESEAILEQLAYRDFLTQISNRPAFLDALLRAIARAKRNQGILAVIYLDIDNFKEINDQWGHSMGDTVLCEITNRLTNFSRTIDLLARLGGDEFAILLEDIANLEEINAIATRYISAFSDPFMINGTKIFVTLSIGVALYPEHGETDKELLSHADKNMYIAKEQGKNQFVL